MTQQQAKLSPFIPLLPLLFALVFLVVLGSFGIKTEAKKVIRIQPGTLAPNSTTSTPKVHDQKKRTCSTQCICADGGWSSPYGLYCGSSYYSCTGQQPCDGIDYCCSFYWDCEFNGGTPLSCDCYQRLYVCSKNMQSLIISGYETSAFCSKYELSATSSIILGTAFTMPFITGGSGGSGCATPQGEDFLFKSYAISVRKFTYSLGLTFDYMSGTNLMGDRVQIFSVGSCEDTCNCGYLNITDVRRSVYGSINIPWKTLQSAVPWSGHYELRYFIEDDDYIYWVATSNSFSVTKSQD